MWDEECGTRNVGLERRTRNVGLECGTRNVGLECGTRNMGLERGTRNVGLECGTGTWDWNVGMEHGTGLTKLLGQKPGCTYSLSYSLCSLEVNLNTPSHVPVENPVL